MGKLIGSPRLEARIAGGLYLLNILVGITALILINRRMQAQGDLANFIAGVIYTGVTILLWHLFRPVNKWISAVAAIFSLMGCWLPQSVYTAAHLNNFVCFGVYCLLIAYLIARSRFFPGALALPMACSGICWLTTIWPPLAHALSPYSMLVGVMGEATFTGYLLLRGLDEQRWRDQAKLA
jgi:hypothetical protein